MFAFELLRLVNQIKAPLGVLEPIREGIRQLAAGPDVGLGPLSVSQRGHGDGADDLYVERRGRRRRWRT